MRKKIVLDKNGMISSADFQFSLSIHFKINLCMQKFGIISITFYFTSSGIFPEKSKQNIRDFSKEQIYLS